MMHSLTHSLARNLPWSDESCLVVPNERPAVIMSSNWPLSFRIHVHDTTHRYLRWPPLHRYLRWPPLSALALMCSSDLIRGCLCALLLVSAALDLVDDAAHAAATTAEDHHQQPPEQDWRDLVALKAARLPGQNAGGWRHGGIAALFLPFGAAVAVRVAAISVDVCP